MDLKFLVKLAKIFLPTVEFSVCSVFYLKCILLFSIQLHEQYDNRLSFNPIYGSMCWGGGLHVVEDPYLELSA